MFLGCCGLRDSAAAVGERRALARTSALPFPLPVPPVAHLPLPAQPDPAAGRLGPLQARRRAAPRRALAGPQAGVRRAPAPLQDMLILQRCGRRAVAKEWRRHAT